MGHSQTRLIPSLSLFFLGFFLSLLIDHLMQTHGVGGPTPGPYTGSGTQHSPLNAFHRHSQPAQIYSKTIAKTPPWLPLSFGLLGVIVGHVVPRIDAILKIRRRVSRSAAVRLVGGVLGINYAASKIKWENNGNANAAIALLSLGIWFLFDRTIHGCILSILFAFIGTTFTLWFVSHGIYHFETPDLWGLRAWFPAILFLSSVCFGAVGRLMIDLDITTTDGTETQKVS
ncbi:Insulin-induced protein 1 protein [Rhizoclosmatium hyalinum]|nr:Insulin-induced protein 1 protein [Rhizoclosmatium hyalinum]